MSESGHERRYEFPDGLPLEPVRAGSTLLVTGPSHAGTRDLALRLASTGDDEGTIIVTTDRSGSRVVADCETLSDALDRTRLGIVDCVGDDPADVRPTRLLTVSGPDDLTGIGMRYSKLYQELHDDGVDRVRTLVHSASTLLMFAELKTVSRFVHTITGRIDAVDGLGAVLVDPSIHDERTVNTLGGFCDGRVDVRERAGASELRARGLRDQPSDWRSFSL